MQKPPRPLPQATPETKEYWDGLKAHELRIQRCSDCSEFYFFPRPFCPSCHSQNVAFQKVSGKGKLHSYVIAHRGHPAFDAPYVIAIVELNEGPKMMTNIIGVDDPTPEKLPADAAVEIVFDDVNENVTLPQFKLV
ncbi:MAG: OB-fold domain-containing protein [Chloroflexi bacterium]|nr:OB-fold domain-containing protein [Chloroflexota bacterium]MDA1003584.1 OB-fold domain-containing protein [Chloroflexota bacterium]